MKVFVLGGYGKTGFPAIKLLAQSDLVTKIAIAGRSLELAEKAATEIGEMATAVHADGTDEQKLASLLTDYDLIINAATNDAVLPAIRAAIHTATHYCDMSWGVAGEQALQLTSEAKVSGITSILATGVSPCISNLMGVHASRQLEEVEQLHLGRADIYNFQTGKELTPRQWFEDPKESLTVLYEFRPFFVWMLQKVQENGMRTVHCYQDGRWEETDPVRSGVKVPITQGGISTLYPYASSGLLFDELPRDLSNVSPVVMQFSPFPPQLHELLRELALGVVGGDIDSDTTMNSFYDTVESDPGRWLTHQDDFIPVPKMWVRALGWKEGYAARYSCWFTAPMWNVGGYFLTSVALAVAVLKILRGEIEERGVMTAENAFEPLPFLDEVASLLSESLPNGKMIGETFEWLE